MNSCSVSYDHMKMKQVTGKIEKNKKRIKSHLKAKSPGLPSFSKGNESRYA